MAAIVLVLFGGVSCGCVRWDETAGLSFVGVDLGVRTECFVALRCSIYTTADNGCYCPVALGGQR